MLTRRQFTSLPGAVAAAILAGCALGERPSFDDEPTGGTIADANGRPITKVAMIGDSITEGSRVPIGFALGTLGLYDSRVDAQVGRRIAVGNGVSEPESGISVMGRMLAEGVAPQLWIIALGTNDIANYPDDQYAATIDQLLLMPALTDRVVWIDAYRPSHANETTAFNSALRERVASRGNALVMSWVDTAGAPGADLLTSDQVHPNEAGNVAFAQLVADGIRTAAAQL